MPSCFSGSSGNIHKQECLDGPLENCNLRISCQVVFSFVLVVLSSPRSKAKINIVKLFLFVLCKNVSSSCYICQAPRVIINTSNRALDAIMTVIRPRLTHRCSSYSDQTDRPRLAGLGGRLMESHKDNLDRDKLIEQRIRTIDEKIAPDACFL